MAAKKKPTLEERVEVLEEFLTREFRVDVPNLRQTWAHDDKAQAESARIEAKRAEADRKQHLADRRAQGLA